MKRSIVLCLTFFASSWIAEANDSTEETTRSEGVAAQTTTNVLESIQIRGVRTSLVESINNKRLSESIVDSISAEEIGKFPDKNVAESLQRVTGVSLTRVQGEGERVGVRGTAPSQNQTYLNGQNIASTDWWISSQPNRGFNFTLLPAEIVRSLDVHKSPEADHDEGSLGGSINIRTHKPLDTKRDLFIATAQMQYSDVSNKYDPQLSLLYNWVNRSQDFGVLVSASRHERQLRRDGLESWGWAERNFNITDNGQLSLTENEQADIKSLWSPGGGGSAVFEQHRVLTSLMASVQYQPDLHWSFELNTLYSDLSANNSNQNFLWMPSFVYDRGGNITDYLVRDNTLIYAQYGEVPEQSGANIPFNTSMEAIWRESNIDTSLVHFIADYQSEYWQYTFELGHTRASGGTSKDYTSQWSANTSYHVDLSAQKNIVADYQISPNDADSWHVSEVRWDQQDSIDQETFLQTDIERQLDHSVIKSVQFGAKWKQHKRDYIRLRSRNGGYNGMAGDLTWTLADFSANFPSDYLNGIGNEKTLKSYAFADIGALDSAFSQLSFNHSEEKPSSFDIREDVLASYAKLNFEGEGYRGNIGVRLIHTDQKAGAYRKIDESDSIFEEYVWTDSSKQYTDVLPSINIATDLHEDMVFRISASKVMARPQYHHLMPSTNYNVTQAQGAGGNPELDPYRATNFDLTYEWYFAEASLFSVAAFHKDIASFIDVKRSIEPFEDIAMVINRPINGSGGQIYGVEFNHQHELVYGLGFITNYTYVQGRRKAPETGEKIDIPGNSEHTFNLTGYYENDWLSARLSYNYRTEFATGVGEEITDDYGQWDINLSFNLNERLSVVVEGINLFDDINYTYERNEFAPVGIYRNGRRVYAGLRVVF